MQLKREGIDYRLGDAIDPINQSKQFVEAYAADVARITDFNVGDDPSGLAKHLGARIHYQDISEWAGESGSIFVHGMFDFDICLPSYTHPLRDRFTVAHELGHYYLHAGQGSNPIIAFRSGSTLIEWEANWFAAALLMPKDQFTKAFQRSRDLFAVAREFKVSSAAAEVRKNVLNL